MLREACQDDVAKRLKGGYFMREGFVPLPCRVLGRKQIVMVDWKKLLVEKHTRLSKWYFTLERKQEPRQFVKKMDVFEDSKTGC